jgi:Tfp pilus assembly protein PilN
VIDPSPGSGQAEREEARRRFWRNLGRVMTVQVVSLILLWLLQSQYAR